jgi:hypothetical protein
MGPFQAVSARPGKPLIESLHCIAKEVHVVPSQGLREEKMRRTTILLAAVGDLTAFPPFNCKDKEVRQYIESEPRPYLDSLTKEVCAARDRDRQLESWLCPASSEIYHPVPSKGKP